MISSNKAVNKSQPNLRASMSSMMSALMINIQNRVALEKEASRKRIEQEMKTINHVVGHQDSMQTLQSLNRNRIKQLIRVTETKAKHSHPLIVDDFELYDVDIKAIDKEIEKKKTEKLKLRPNLK